MFCSMVEHLLVTILRLIFLPVNKNSSDILISFRGLQYLTESLIRNQQ